MTAMTVQAQDPRISAEEFLSHDYPIGSELIDGVVHVNDATFRHHRGRAGRDAHGAAAARLRTPDRRAVRLGRGALVTG
jgi:hypothetical protein